MDAQPLEERDVRRAADALARAFDTDPFTRWLFPDPGRRRRYLPGSFERQLRHVYLPKGHCYTDPVVSGAALWAPPGRWQLPYRTQARLFPFFARTLGLARLPSVGRVFTRVERAHPAEPHWYLGILGVAPDRQGAGVGSTLIAPVLELADSSRTLCYLETSAPSNLPYYERHGFRVRERLELPSGAPPMWTMLRTPR